MGLAVMAGVCSGWAVSVVTEGARSIPIVHTTDVVVVGGSSGAASAAIAAASSGARVFLLAPRPYLGDDLCETRRLWLEEGEVPGTPLAKRMFAIETASSRPGLAEGNGRPEPGALAFTYEASLPSDARHRDTKTPSLLSDKFWGRPENQSVQYNGDVTLTARVSGPGLVREAAVVLYRRAGDFDVDSVVFESSADGKAWAPAGTVKSEDLSGEVVTARAPVTGAAREVRMMIRRREGSDRLLVGEVLLSGTNSAAAAPAAPVADYARWVRPMQVKRVLDEAMLEAKADFLFSCFPSEILRDASGAPCGIVMANRAGRQAILAKVIIDATPRAVVARMAGASFAPYPGDGAVFTRVVTGAAPAEGPGLKVRRLEFSVRTAGGRYAPPSSLGAVFECAVTVPMRGTGFSDFAEADQSTRDRLWHPAQLEVAEALFQTPPDPVRSVRAFSGAWSQAGESGLDAFRPAGLARVYVLGGCGEVTREAAGKLLRPLALMDLGARIGQAAAREAAGLPQPKAAGVTLGPVVAAPAGETPFSGKVRELLSGVRPTQRGLATLKSPDRALPVLGRYDVVVVGGGTGGAPAGIGASRGGAKTLLLEYLYGLGGVGTQGRIITYYHGYRGGFTAMVDAGVKELGASNYVAGKSEWWRQANRKAGTEIWLGVIGCGALVEDGVVRGVVVVTPFGRGVVLAKTVIDSTGNADIAAAAGAAWDYTGAEDVGVQGAGLPPLDLGDHYTNTDWTFADDTDVVDFWQHHILARQKFRSAYDLGQLVDTRERRRVIGDVVVTPMDIILGRTWPDTINQAMSNFDTHGFTVHSIFFAMPPDRKSMTVFVPMRALTPKGLDGIVVTGLGASAHRDAMPVIRMQPDVQNQGYACGRAAAMAAASASSVRQIDFKALQKHLVELEALPVHCLTDSDSMPLSKAQIEAAVAGLAKPEPGLAAEVDSAVRNRQALAQVMAQPADALAALEKTLAGGAPADRIACAVVLGLMGRPSAAPLLSEAVRRAPVFDKGWNYTGMGQFGRSASELDACLIALGRTRDSGGVDAVLEKLRLLDSAVEFSHHRACAMALESMADPRAAAPLAALLGKPGMSGHAFTSLEKARAGTGAGATETRPRNESLRELVLARALFRCGDSGGLGRRILLEYASDLRGHYASHARAVLEEKSSNTP